MLNLDPLIVAKFWMHVEIDKNTPMLRTAKKWLGHCWQWKHSFFLNGYGRFFLHQKAFKSHRIAYMICYGDIPQGMYVCHKCDNPKCVNPLHLFLGTAKANVDDMIAKERLNRFRSKSDNRSSRYSGISFRKETNKWRVRIMRNYQSILIGEFDCEEVAYQAKLSYLNNK